MTDYLTTVIHKAEDAAEHISMRLGLSGEWVRKRIVIAILEARREEHINEFDGSSDLKGVQLELELTRRRAERICA